MKLLAFALVMMSGFTSVQAFAAGTQERALIAFMRVSPGAQARFLAEARDVIRDSRQESGVITYQLHQSEKDPQQFVFYELFRNAGALEFHKNSSHVKSFLARTKPITLQFTLQSFKPVGGLE